MDKLVKDLVAGDRTWLGTVESVTKTTEVIDGVECRFISVVTDHITFSANEDAEIEIEEAE